LTVGNVDLVMIGCGFQRRHRARQRGRFRRVRGREAEPERITDPNRHQRTQQ
jgi:hypothetical protein